MKTAAKRNHIVRHRSYIRHLTRSLYRTGLWVFVVLGLCGIFSYTRAGTDARVYAATSSNLNFQARLQTGAGSIVNDGNYSIQFKIYNTSTGGSPLWTETQATTRVVNGYMTVSLGSVTAFPGTIDWSQEHWLTMNVNSDGEMNPRLKLTAVPYAFRSGQADSLTNGSGTLGANDLAQLSPGTPQIVNTLLAALRLNQTGAGGLLQFQQGGVDVFSVAGNGNLISSGSGTFSGGSLVLGSATQLGGLVFHDGDGQTGTIQTTNLGSNRTYTLPNASGIICLTTTCAGGGGANSYIQDGNSFGGLATLGTDDNFDLHFETNGTTKLKVLTNGNVGIGTSGSPSSLLSVGGTTGNFTVDSSGNVATGGTTRLTSGGALQNINGLTVISGGADITGNVQASGQFLGANGSSAAPAYSFTNDTNSGIYSGGADNLRFVTGGVDRLTLTNNGMVGVGTTDPSAALQVANGTTSMFGYIDSPFVSFGAYQNFLLQTEAFNTANWVKTGIGAVTANSATDPRLVATAENIPAGGSGTSSLSQVITNSTTGDWNFSIYLRSQAGTVTADLRIDSNGPQTGTTKTVTLTPEWQRFAVTQNLSVAHTTKTVFIVSGTNAISAWGAQLEPISYARPYSGARTTVALPAVTTTAQIGTALNTTGALSIAGALTGATTGAFSNVLTVTGAGIAAASTDRLAITNTTAATAAIPVQMSPRLRFTGSVWNTTTGTTNTSNWKVENLPLSGASPIGQLVFGHDLAGGGYSNALVLGSNGDAAFAGGLSTGGTSRLTSTGVLQNITGLTVISGGASIAGNVTLGGSSSDRITITGQILGGTPLVFQGATNNGFATTFSITDPTANNTITVPNASGTLLLDSRSILTPAGSGLTGGGNLSVDRSLSLDINGLTTTTTINNGDYLAIYDGTSTIKKVSRSDLLQGIIGALQYRGTWSASTNTPTLADNTGTIGHVYAVSTGGTQNLGSGNVTFGAGDFVIHNGTKWEVAPSASPVVSIFGRGGTVTAQGGDYTAAQITNTPAGNLSSTTVQAALNELDTEKLGSLNGLTATSQTFANDTNITVTSSGSTHTLGWTGQLSVTRGGTGAASFTSNGLLYGNGTNALQVTAAGTPGQVLIADGSGVPTFRTISGDLTIDANGVATVSGAANDSVALGTDTTGDYVMNLGSLIGLSTTGNSGEGSTPGLSVLYGSIANTAVQGNTTLVCTSGTGNLSGGGGTITLGAGGSCGAISITNAPTFTTSVTSPIYMSTGGLSITSGGSSDITLDSASDKLVIAASDNTLQRTASGSYTVDLNDAANTTLVLNNSGAGLSNLNLQDGGLQTNSITRLDNAGNLTNIGNISASGNISTTGQLVEKSVTFTPTGVGWYRIATGVNMMGGTIRISAPLYDNTLTDVELQYSVSGYGAAGSIQQTRFSSYNNGVVSAARSSTDGVATLYLDIFISNATAPQPITIYGYGPNQPAFVASPVVGAAVGSSSVNFLTLGQGFRSTQGAIFAETGGTVGIGTSGTPSSLLSIGGTTGNLTVDASGNLATGGTTRLTVGGALQNITGLSVISGGADINGNVGFSNDLVNTAAANANFKISGTSTGRYLQVITSPTGATLRGFGNSSNGLTLGGGNNDQLILDAAGNVGIGISGTANALLSIGGTTGNLTVDASGNLATGGTTRLTVGGALQNITGLTIISGGANITGSIDNNSGGITEAGALAGVTTISASGAITAATATNTINGLVINSGALSSITGITFTSGSLNLASGGIVNTGSIAGATTINASGLATLSAGANVTGDITVVNGKILVQHATAGASIILDKTSVGGKIGSLKSGDAKVAFFFDDTGSFSISKDTRANIAAGTGAGVDILTALASGNIGIGDTTPLALLTVGNGDLFQVNSSGAIAAAVGITSTGGDITLNNNSNFATSISTGTSTGTVTIGGGSAPLVINSTAFDVSSTGALSGITTINASGLATITGGATISGAAISLNASSNFAVDVGTGTSTGAVTIGGGSNAFSVASTGIDISAAGAISNSNSLTSVNNTNLTLNALGTGSLVFTGYDCTGQSNGGALTTNAAGVVACSADDSGISDARLKKNVTNLNDSILDKIKEVRTVNFDFDCNQQFFEERVLDCLTAQQTGVIAQELAQIFPELVYQADDGYYRVKYDALNIYTLKAVSELAKKVDATAGSSAPDGVRTGGTLRLDSAGKLQNITGMELVSGGASINGGINGNGGGLTNTGSILGATAIEAQNITLRATGEANLLTLTKDGNGVFTIFNDGALEIKISNDKAFAVQNAGGKDYFNVNTNGGLVNIGSSMPDEQAILLVLDSKNTPGDPTGINGAQYYNAAINKFRCYQNDKWQDCLPVAATVDHVLMSHTQNWNQPSADQEFPDEPRTWVDLTSAREFRVTARLIKAGAAGASCRMEYALNDNGPWSNLYQDKSSDLSLDVPGTLKTDWTGIATGARKEVLIRIMCKGGDYNKTTATGATPQFNDIKLQIR